MKDLTSTITESVRLFGQTFLVAHYIPALIFVSIHIYLLFPIWAEKPLSFMVAMIALVMPSNSNPSLQIPFESILSSVATLLIASLAIGLVLSVFNNAIIRLFEGNFYWVRRVILRFWTNYNRKKSQKFFGKYKDNNGHNVDGLIELRRRYHRAHGMLSSSQSVNVQNNFEKEIQYSKNEINNRHKRLEGILPYPSVPVSFDRIMPTSFGNNYAITEEYPYERYGIDTVLFWPRLRLLMITQASEHSTCISRQKNNLDMTLNLTLVCSLLAIEIFITSFGFFWFTYYGYLLIGLSFIMILLSVSFYHAGVGAVRVLGELIKISFDQYRHLLLESFNIEKPNDLMVERKIWLDLAKFIRWGDPFYFPKDYLKEAESISQDENN